MEGQIRVIIEFSTFSISQDPIQTDVIKMQLFAVFWFLNVPFPSLATDI